MENDKNDDNALAVEEVEKVVSVAVDEVVENRLAGKILLGDVRKVEGKDDEVTLGPSGEDVDRVDGDPLALEEE